MTKAPPDYDIRGYLKNDTSIEATPTDLTWEDSTHVSPSTDFDDFGVYFDNIFCPSSTYHASHSLLDSFMPMAEGVHSHHTEGLEGMGNVSCKAEADAEAADSVSSESPEQAIEEDHQPTPSSPVVESHQQDDEAPESSSSQQRSPAQQEGSVAEKANATVAPNASQEGHTVAPNFPAANTQNLRQSATHLDHYAFPGPDVYQDPFSTRTQSGLRHNITNTAKASLPYQYGASASQASGFPNPNPRGNASQHYRTQNPISQRPHDLQLPEATKYLKDARSPQQPMTYSTGGVGAYPAYFSHPGATFTSHTNSAPFNTYNVNRSASQHLLPRNNTNPYMNMNRMGNHSLSSPSTPSAFATFPQTPMSYQYPGV